MNQAFLDYHHSDSVVNTAVIHKSDEITVMTESIEQRLLRLRKAAGLTQSQLAAAAKVSQGTIGNLESGLRKYGESIVNIAAALNVTPEYLRGEDEHKAAPVPTPLSNFESAFGSRGLVPLISWVQAGNWNDAIDTLHPGDAEDWVPCVRKHSPSSFALRVRGDSMTAPHGNTRTYPEGCIIFVDPEKRTPINGDRIIAKLSGPTAEVTFKVFKQEDGRMWLHALNPAHEPIRDEFKVLGTIIGKWEDE